MGSSIDGFPTPRMPALLQTLSWVVRPVSFLTQCEQKFGPVFHLDLAGWAEHIIVGDASIAKQLIKHAENGRLLTGQTNQLMAPVVSDCSIFLLDGKDHKIARRYLQQSLKSDCLAAAMSIGGETVDEILSEHRFELSSKELSSLIGMCSLAYILTLILGKVSADEVRKVHRQLALVLGPVATYFAFATPLHRSKGIFRLWRWAEQKLVLLRVTLEALVHRAQSVQSGIEPAARHIYAADSPFVSDDEKYHQLLSLLAAGFDTVTTATGWAMIWLSRDEVLTEQLRDHCSDMTKKSCKNSQDNSVKLLRWTCLEALRLTPVIEIVSRTPKTSIFLMEQKVENGIFLSPCSYLIHRDPKIYRNPLSFDPHRFSEGMPQQWEYFPFGFGERRCIGANLGLMQMEAVICKLLSQRQMQFLDKGNPKEVRRHVTIQPASLPRVKLNA